MHRVRVGGVGAAAGLEDELVHPESPRRIRSKPWTTSSTPWSVSSSCSGCSSAISGRAASSVASRGLYFIVHVPNRLMPIIPSVFCERCR